MQRETEIKFNWTHLQLRLPGGKTLAIPEACNFLQGAKVKKCNPLSNGSNYVFLLALENSGMKFKAIYKPRQGEVPLWDFPNGTLYRREYAAFIVSQALGWYLIPPTVIRGGPSGVGSMQWFIDTAGGTVNCMLTEDISILKQVALFDYLVNNADRKLGHFIIDRNSRLWVVDHGLTFNAAPKLRTVLWNFSGQTIPDVLLVDVRALQSKLKQEKQLRDTLRHLLDKSEVQALEFRIKAIIEKPVFVYPGLQRSVPWPWY